MLDRLAEHRRLGLDAADAPAEHAEAVDHRGVAVGAHAGVRVGLAVADHDHPRQVLDVHLMHDAGPGRHHLELVERRLAPAQELVALEVALVLPGHVALEGVRRAEVVRDDRVVDDQLRRGQRVDPVRIPAEVAHRLAHRRQVHHARHPGEVLHDHPGGGELDLVVRLGVGVPGAERADLVGGHVGAVLGPQQVLQQDLVGERQPARPLDRADREDLEGLAADRQRVFGGEGIEARHGRSSCRLGWLHPRSTGALGPARSRSGHGFGSSPATHST